MSFTDAIALSFIAPLAGPTTQTGDANCTERIPHDQKSTRKVQFAALIVRFATLRVGHGLPMYGSVEKRSAFRRMGLYFPRHDNAINPI